MFRAGFVMLKIFLLTLLVLVIQVQILPIFNVQLDLLILVTIYWGLVGGWQIGLWTGLMSGFIQDVYSGGVFGLAPIGFVMCGLLAGYSRKMLLLRYWPLRISLVFLLTALNLLIYLIMSSFFYDQSLFVLFKQQWFSICIGNTIIAALVFWFLDRRG